MLTIKDKNGHTKFVLNDCECCPQIVGKCCECECECGEECICDCHKKEKENK